MSRDSYSASVLAIRPLYVFSNSRLFDIRVFLLVAKDHAGGSWARGDSLLLGGALLFFAW